MMLGHRGAACVADENTPSSRRLMGCNMVKHSGGSGTRNCQQGRLDCLQTKMLFCRIFGYFLVVAQGETRRSNACALCGAGGRYKPPDSLVDAETMAVVTNYIASLLKPMYKAQKLSKEQYKVRPRSCAPRAPP